MSRRRARCAAGMRALAAALVVASCGPTRGTPITPVREETLSSEVPFLMELELVRHDAVYVDSLAADPELAWRELPAVFAALGLPVHEADPTARQLGVHDHRMGRIEGKRPSVYLDCGRGPAAAANADRFDVYLTVLTRLGAVPQGSTVASVVSARARPRDVSGTTVACTSQAVLERRVAELLRDRLGLPRPPGF